MPIVKMVIFHLTHTRAIWLSELFFLTTPSQSSTLISRGDGQHAGCDVSGGKNSRKLENSIVCCTKSKKNGVEWGVQIHYHEIFC